MSYFLPPTPVSATSEESGGKLGCERYFILQPHEKWELPQQPLNQVMRENQRNLPKPKLAPAQTQIYTFTFIRAGQDADLGKDKICCPQLKGTNPRLGLGTEGRRGTLDFHIVLFSCCVVFFRLHAGCSGCSVSPGMPQDSAPGAYCTHLWLAPNTPCAQLEIFTSVKLQRFW